MTTQNKPGLPDLKVKANVTDGQKPARGVIPFVGEIRFDLADEGQIREAVAKLFKILRQSHPPQEVRKIAEQFIEKIDAEVAKLGIPGPPK